MDITKAIKAINPSASVTIRGLDLDTCTIEWLEGTAEISKADIQTKINELQAEYDALEWKRNRLSEYPSLNEFAEAYTEKEIGGDSTKWDAYVINYNKVRTENPK